MDLIGLSVAAATGAGLLGSGMLAGYIMGRRRRLGAGLGQSGDAQPGPDPALGPIGRLRQLLDDPEVSAGVKAMIGARLEQLRQQAATSDGNDR